jgi:uncharacterized protein (DUF983 family)
VRVLAILKQRCPRCLRGAVFEGLLRMRETCERCGLRFEREPGFFVGAMYVSYALAVALGAPLAFGLLEVGVPLGRTMLALAVALVALHPLLFRYSRVIWLHVDHRIRF